jgi:hypothetical protein
VGVLVRGRPAGQAWFEDEEFAKGITGNDGKDLVAVKAPGNLHKVLLLQAAKHLAHRQFCTVIMSNRERLASAAFLNGYLRRVSFPADA